MTEQRTRLEVTGMSCANCAETIEDRLSGLDGVTDVSVNFATDEATVSYDDPASLSDIYDAVADAGYDARSETVTIAISDMSCANCAESNESALLDTSVSSTPR